jgi:hypothetical protein
LTPKPKRTETAIIDPKYRKRADFPKIFFTSAMVPTFVAGPTSRKTKAAPGERPLEIRTAANGVEAVAQTYMGNPITTANTISRSGFPISLRILRSEGRRAPTTAEKSRPKAIREATSSKRRKKEFLVFRKKDSDGERFSPALEAFM